MRWKTPKKTLPNYGDKREVTKFLLFPKCMGEEWRWLEKATWTQQYQIFHYEDYRLGRWVDMNSEYWINP
jgi:hypothetical protein